MGLVDAEPIQRSFMVQALNCDGESFVFFHLEWYTRLLQCVDHAVDIVSIGLIVYWKYSDVSDVDEVGLPRESVEDNIHTAPESCGVNYLSKVHAIESIRARVACDCGLVPVHIGNWDLPVAPDDVKRWNGCCIS